jgi:hypothetical protein
MQKVGKLFGNFQRQARDFKGNSTCAFIHSTFSFVVVTQHFATVTPIGF